MNGNRLRLAFLTSLLLIFGSATAEQKIVEFTGSEAIGVDENDSVTVDDIRDSIRKMHKALDAVQTRAA